MSHLRVLLAEDSEDDAMLVLYELEHGGYQVTSERIEAADQMRRALEDRRWDIVISDYSMPQFNALDALALLRASNQAELPFLIVSGSIGEEAAVAALKAGASNYLMKQHMAELLPMVRRELADARMRRERSQAFAALEQAVSARDEFLSIASHELKTPLTSLRLQAQNLLRAARQSPARILENDQVLRRLEVLDRNAERLTLIVERMLEINRLTSGHMRLSRERVDLAALLRESLATMTEMIREAGCQVALDAPEHLMAHLDRERIMTVIANLLSNAVKYGAGRPIDVVLEQRETAAVLRVTDRGIGIPAPDQRRIFERFERAVPEKHYGGFGVGLWLARQFVVAHGGQIEVESEPRQGSTFVVTLPLEAA